MREPAHRKPVTRLTANDSSRSPRPGAPNAPGPFLFPMPVTRLTPCARSPAAGHSPSDAGLLLCRAQRPMRSSTPMPTRMVLAVLAFATLAAACSEGQIATELPTGAAAGGASLLGTVVNAGPTPGGAPA